MADTVHENANNYVASEFGQVKQVCHSNYSNAWFRGNAQSSGRDKSYPRKQQQ
jgi:hypothetical protein